MFAYCNNNPVNCVDSTGYSLEYFLKNFADCIKNSGGALSAAGTAALADSPALGPGDAVAAAIVISTLLVCIATAAIDAITAETTLQSNDEEIVGANSIAIGQETRRYQYWEAARVNNNVVVGRGLTFSEAKARVASGFDIMCANQGAALWLVVTNGYWNAVGPEIHGDDGYFWHFHPNRNSHLHIWFY